MKNWLLYLHIFIMPEAVALGLKVAFAIWLVQHEFRPQLPTYG
ncbi:MAG: hypothetical protein V4722_00380 [Bacteroidota bacterium]